MGEGVTDEGVAERRALGVRALDALPREALEAELRTCCGSSAWVRGVADARPFGTYDALIAAADRVWAGVSKDDRLEAFRAHPRIGGRKAEVSTGVQSARWSAQEQSSVASAEQAVLDELARVNAEYEARFGHIYIVCATGRSADEMLALAKSRMANDPERELSVAAEEQRKITALRLARLVERGR